MALATPLTAKQIHVNQYNSSNIFMITNINTYNFYNFGINGNKTVMLSDNLNMNQFLFVGIGTNIGASTLSILSPQGASICVLSGRQIAQLLDNKMLGLIQEMPISALTSVGSNIPIYTGLSNSVADFRNISSGSFLNVRGDAGTIYIDTNPNLSVVHISSVGSGLPIYNGPTNGVVTYNTISAGSYVSINSSNNNYQITATGYSLIGLNNDLRITKITLNNLGIIAGDPSPNGTVAITRGTSTPVSSGCVSYGYQAGQTSQSINAVALGYQAGKTSQGTGTVAIGSASGQTLQSAGAVAIGDNTGNNLQSSGAVAIGTLAGQSSQGIGAVAIGYGTGSSSQGSYAVALGFSSGQTSQGTKSVAIGNSSGVLSQGANSIAVGIYEGNKLQGSGSIAIGLFTGDNTQGSNSIAIGLHAGETLLGVNSISIGSFSNHEVVGNNVISIGSSAGQVLTGDNSIAIGTSTATAATAAVIIGRSSNSGGVNTVNIGANSNTVGDYSISIGYLNSANNDNSICFGTSCGDVVEGSLNFANVQPYTAILSAKSIPIYWNSTPYYVPIYDSVDTLNNTFYFNLIRNRQYNGPAFNMMFNNTSIVLSGVNDNLIYDSLNARFVANYSAVYMVTAQMCLNISASGTNIESSWSFMRNGDVILQFPFNYLNSQTKSGNVTAMAAFRMNVTAGDTIEFPVSLNFSISGYSTNTISLTNDTGNRNYVLFEHI